MYTIFIQDRPLYLCTTDDVGAVVDTRPNRLTMPYTGKPKMLLNFVDTLEKNQRYTYIRLHYSDVETLFTDFSRHYKVVEAAGGVVQNDRQETLFLYRLGRWDLPKGKIDPGETPPQAALREVREETGLEQLSLLGSAHMTYHTYRDNKDRRVLKPTYWYRMQTPERLLTPQVEEHIEAAVWRPAAEVIEQESLLYPSLRRLLLELAHGEAADPC